MPEHGGGPARDGLERVNAALAHELGERVKELHALHRCARLLLAVDRGEPALLAAVAALLPPAFEHPDRTTGAVRLGDRLYATPGHAETAWMLRHELTTADGRPGAIEVAYHGPPPGRDDARGPFLPEESELLESLGDMLRLGLDRRRADDDRVQVRERLDLALTAASMGVWERDLVTERVTWSAHMARLIGRDGELTGQFRDFAHLVHPDDARELEAFLAAVCLSEQPRTVEFRLCRTDGTWRPVAATGRGYFGPDGRPRRVIGVVMDITGRRALEAGLRQAQKLETLGQVAGGVAHDFNNLLSVVTSDCGLLQLQVTDELQRELLDEIAETAARATALTRQLLAFSRRAEFQPAEVELDRLTDRLRPLLVRLAGPAITVTTSLAAEGASVWADPSQLEQLVVNLVVNARDAMPDGGTITVTTAVVPGAAGTAAKADEGQVVLAVGDTGAGIPLEVIDRIFEPFFTTKAPGQGTGLGLAVVRAVARQWRGEVTVDSGPGRGATFRVELPRHVPVPG